MKNMKSIMLSIKNILDNKKTNLKHIDSMAYDGIKFLSNYVTPSGDYKQYEAQFKQFAYLSAPVNIGQNIQNLEDCTLYRIHYALQKIEQLNQSLFCVFKFSVRNIKKHQ